MEIKTMSTKEQLKQRAIKLYREAYRVEYLAIKNGVYSESELYDIRFQIQQEYIKDNAK